MYRIDKVHALDQFWDMEDMEVDLKISPSCRCSCKNKQNKQVGYNVYVLYHIVSN